MCRPIRVAVLLVLVFLVVAPSAPLLAEKAGVLPADHPLLKRIASMTVERGREHRALLVYPLAAEMEDPLNVARPMSSAEAVANQDFSVGEPPKKGGRGPVEAFNWGGVPVLLMGGEVLVGGVRDRFLTRDVLLGPGHKVNAPALLADRSPRPKGEELKAFDPLDGLVPDVMRLVGIADAPDKHAADFLKDLLAISGEVSPRGSVADLFNSKRIKERMDEYRAIFPAIPDEAGRKVIGVAVLAGNRLLGIDLFDTNAAFRAHWPKILRTAALQAALYEAAYGLLNRPFPGGRDPDRHLPDIRATLKKPFAARFRKVKPVDHGEEIVITRDELVGRVLVDGGRLVHAVLLLDYISSDANVPPPPGTTPSEVTPGELQRRAARGTLTEYEKRLLERMNERRQRPQPLPRPNRPEDETPTPGGGR